MASKSERVTRNHKKKIPDFYGLVMNLMAVKVSACADTPQTESKGVFHTETRRFILTGTSCGEKNFFAGKKRSFVPVDRIAALTNRLRMAAGITTKSVKIAAVKLKCNVFIIYNDGQ